MNRFAGLATEEMTDCPECGTPTYDELCFRCKTNKNSQPVVAKQRVVVSIRGGLVSAVYGSETDVEVLIVDHDNIAAKLGEDGEFEGAGSGTLVPLDQLDGDTGNAVRHYDDLPLECEQCGDEFDPTDRINKSYSFCTEVCEQRQWGGRI